ncbi:MAG: hypothetical protein ABSG89_13125 [Bacteroidales bacterium]|jgi:hypothetical protein
MIGLKHYYYTAGIDKRNQKNEVFNDETGVQGFFVADRQQSNLSIIDNFTS